MGRQSPRHMLSGPEGEGVISELKSRQETVRLKKEKMALVSWPRRGFKQESHRPHSKVIRMGGFKAVPGEQNNLPYAAARPKTDIATAYLASGRGGMQNKDSEGGVE